MMIRVIVVEEECACTVYNEFQSVRVYAAGFGLLENISEDLLGLILICD